jgi:tetratricopeptide (TPR) repeat protein
LDDYLQGRYLYWNKRTEENLRKAIEFFENALRQDPAYALAYVGMADCYTALGTVQIATLSPTEARQKAEEAANKALELDAGLAEPHALLGLVKHFNWNWAEAEEEFKRAIELNPNYSNAHNFYATYLMSRGRTGEMFTASNRSRELDPLSLSIGAHRGLLLFNVRHYDEAIEQLNRVIAVDPNHYQAHWVLGHTYAAIGQFDKAIPAAEKAVALSGRGAGALGVLGMIYGLAGQKDQADQILHELVERETSRYTASAAFVHVYLGLGDTEQTFLWLEKAYQERSNFMIYLGVYPLLDPIRSDPRYADLIQRVGLAP